MIFNNWRQFNCHSITIPGIFVVGYGIVEVFLAGVIRLHIFYIIIRDNFVCLFAIRNCHSPLRNIHNNRRL